MKSLQFNLRKVKVFGIKPIVNYLSFRSTVFLITFLCVGIFLSCSGGDVGSPEIHISGSVFPIKDNLVWIAPEEAGWSSANLQIAHKFATQSECQAAMALYDGKVFFSRGNIHKNYEIDSIKETFLSAL